MGHPLAVDWLGRVPYADALALQERAVAQRSKGLGPDRLLLLEHPPVVTFGRSGRPEHLRSSPEALAARGIEIHHVARGGDVTWHGPGQLVGYLVLDLRARGETDVHLLLRRIEGALAQALVALGLRPATLPGMTGVFLEGAQPPRKIASIGVGLRGWITWHGFALNLTVDLAGFADIVPCGLHGVEMTSVARELRRPAEPALFRQGREAVSVAFLRSFG